MSGLIVAGQDEQLLRHLEHWAQYLGIEAILKDALGGADIYKNPKKRKGCLLEYYFTRTRDKQTRKKILLRINVRVIGQSQFVSIEKHEAERQGANLEDVLKRLVDIGAIKVKPV